MIRNFASSVFSSSFPATARARAVQAAWVAQVASLLITLFTLTACDLGGGSEPSGASPAEDRFHEKSFSWEEPAATPGLAKTATRATRFETPEALAEALHGLEASLQDPAFVDSLWKPVDHVCDELDVALWNVYGAVRLGDAVVLDENVLKTRCTYIGGDDASTSGQLEKSAQASAVYPGREATHRVHPYKMIGRSWDNLDYVVYKSTGSETQFKKHRTKLFTTAWWDTDASRIGVRAYLLNCGTTGSGSQTRRTCALGGLRTGSARNDDYVGQRDFSAGLNVTYTFPTTISASPTKLKVSDAVLGMHSVNHAGLAFRASSSSGLTSATVLASVPPLEYVTW